MRRFFSTFYYNKSRTDWHSHKIKYSKTATTHLLTAFQKSSINIVVNPIFLSIDYGARLKKKRAREESILNIPISYKIYKFPFLKHKVFFNILSKQFYFIIKDQFESCFCDCF